MSAFTEDTGAERMAFERAKHQAHDPVERIASKRAERMMLDGLSKWHSYTRVTLERAVIVSS